MKDFFNSFKTLQEVTEYTKKFKNWNEAITNSENLTKNDKITYSKEILQFLDVDKDVIEFFPLDFFENLIFKFMAKFEARCEEIIEETTGEKKINVGTKVKIKEKYRGTSNIEESIVVKITRFEEDTFHQGWYLYDLEDGGSFYGYELETPITPTKAPKISITKTSDKKL